MLPEISNGHHAAADECRPAREESRGDEDAPEELDHAGQSGDAEERKRAVPEPAEELLDPVEDEEETNDEANDGIDPLLIGAQEPVHATVSFRIFSSAWDSSGATRRSMSPIPWRRRTGRRRHTPRRARPGSGSAMCRWADVP